VLLPASRGNIYDRNGNLLAYNELAYGVTIMETGYYNTNGLNLMVLRLVRLLEKVGEGLGLEAAAEDVNVLLGPGINIKRNPLCGRNFEYYSEDPILSGRIASEAVKGAAEHGVYAYIKHFALNDQETNRTYQLMTWADEQTVREVYLRPFEICVKEGNAKAVMAAFNHYGIIPAYASDNVLNKILRDEWGFRGMVLIDYFGAGGYGYLDANRATRNGTDFCLTAIDAGFNYVKDKSATATLALRKASHNILYTTVNSRAYAPENLNLGMMGWQIAAIVIDIICIVAAVLLALKAWKNYVARKDTDNE